MDDEYLNDGLISRFEQMLENKTHYYFETDEFYEIIAYYLDVGDLPYAKKAIDYAIEMYPSSIDIQIKKLEYLLAVNRLKEASFLISELKETAENDLDYLIAVGRYWSMKENPRMAIGFFEKALESGEDQEYIYNCLGNEYLNLNETDLALYNFKQALELDPDDDGWRVSPYVDVDVDVRRLLMAMTAIVGEGWSGGDGDGGGGGEGARGRLTSGTG